MQFFASLKKWIGARNPVRIGSSCAAVTGYDFPLGQSSKSFGGEGGKKDEARSQNICPVHLIRPANAERKNFFAKRRMRAGRCDAVNGRLTSPTLGGGGNLLCEIVQFGLFRGAHPSRMLVSASRRNNLFCARDSRDFVLHQQSSRSRDALASTRDGRAPQSDSLHYSSWRGAFASHRKLRRLLHQAKRRLSRLSSRQRVLIFRSINRRRV